MTQRFKRVYINGPQMLQKQIGACLENQEKMFIVTANPEILMEAEREQRVADILEDRRVTIVPDGISVIKAMRSMGYEVQERITGVDLSTYLLQALDTMKGSLFLYGAKQEVLDALLQVLRNRYPHVCVLGAHNGYTGDYRQIFQEMIEKKPDVALIALGVPRQELCIHEFYDQFEKGIFMGVGGSLDVLSGAKKRAPKLWIRCNLEWLYRILKEPKRIKRFYRNNVAFMKKVRRERREGDQR